MTTYNSRNIATVKRMVIGLGIFALVAGCSPNPEGDGGASGGVSGLEMATTMSVVAPTGGFNASPAPMKTPNLTISELRNIVGKVISGQVFDPESDYEKDKVDVSVAEDSNESLQFVNLLLCFVKQARIADLVNTGGYTAYLNPSECIAGLSNVGFFRAVVKSDRAFEHSPQYVKIWVPFADFLGTDWSGGLVMELIIFSEANSTNPVGQFEMKMSLEVTPPVGEEGDIPPFLMNTRTVQRNDNKVEFLSFVESGDPFLQDYDRYELGSASVVMDDAQGNSGASVSFNRELKVRCVDTDGFTPIDPCVIDTTQEGFEVVYNLTHLFRRNIGLLNTVTEACFDRTNPFLEARTYGVYYEQNGVVNGNPVSAGQRVDNEKRFGFEYLGLSGWASSYGLNWYSGDSSIYMPDQAVITTTDLASDTYVVHRSEGELSRIIGRTVSIANVGGAPFSYYGNYSGTPGLIATWDGAGRQASDFGFDRWRIVINPSTFNFEIVAGLVQDPVTNEYSISPEPVPVATINQPVDSAGNPLSSPLYLYAFSTNMGYDHSLTGNPATGSLTYTGRYENLFPWHSTLYTAATETGSTTTLYCYSNCLIGGVSAPTGASVITYPSFNTAAPSAVGGLITNAVNLPATEGGLRTYTLQSTGKKYILIDNTVGNGLEVALLDTSAVSFTSQSMSRLRDVQIPLNTLFHPTLAGGGIISATNLPVLKQNESEYTWGTGTRDYYKTYTVSLNTAANPVVPFNELIQFLYQHDLADDINNTLGFPQADIWGGLLTVFDTYDGDMYPYLPDFKWPYTSTRNWNISSINMTKGVVLTDFNNTNYVIKPLGIEQLLVEYEVSPGVSDTLPCTSILEEDRAKNELNLPTVDSVNPMIINFSDIPISIDTPPKVIDGELQ